MSSLEGGQKVGSCWNWFASGWATPSETKALSFIILPAMTFCPQAAPSSDITSVYFRKKPKPFPLACLWENLPTCSQEDLALDLTGQNLSREVSLFDCFSSVLILRPGMVLPLWSHVYSTGLLKKLKLCGQRSLCGQRRLCGWSGCGIWAGALPIVTWVVRTGLEPTALGHLQVTLCLACPGCSDSMKKPGVSWRHGLDF